MDNVTEPTQNPNPTSTPSNQGGLGGKIAIVIIVIVILIGAYYFFMTKRNTSLIKTETQNTTTQTETTESLNKELDNAASANIDAELQNIDLDFN